MGNSVMLNGVEYAGEQIAYKDSTYELVSKVAYLIGVPLRIFQNEHEPPKIEIYDRLEQDKNARIIRNLCIIRTAIERNYRKINDIMRMEYRGLLSMPEIIPASSMQQLSNDGISFIKKSSTKLCHHIIEINRLISDRINNCKSLFPIWINWTYIKELFIMPNGLTEDGTKDAADIYYASLSYYPYQMYINWVPMDEGNVLYNDKKFATLLYQWHCDAFTEYSKVSDAGAFVKNNIYDFIDDSEKTVLVVDCENSDPYKLCATLKNLDYEVIVVLAVLLHPYKSHGLIRKAPCRQHFECFTEARERDPKEQGAVLRGKLTDRKCLDVLNAHRRIVAFCRPPLSFLGVSPIRPRGIGVDDAVLLHAADLLSAHGRWILQGFRS